MIDWVQCSDLGSVGVNGSFLYTDANFLVLVAEQSFGYIFCLCRIKLSVHQGLIYPKQLILASIDSFKFRAGHYVRTILLCKFMQTAQCHEGLCYDLHQLEE